MVKKRKNEEEEPVVIVEEEEQDENVELNAFLNEFSGSDYKVVVRKLSKDGSTWERVKTLPLDQFDPDLLSEYYGGGKYKFTFIDNKGKFIKQFTCVYAEKIKNDIDKQNNQGNQNNYKDDFSLQILLNQLNSNNQMLIEMIRNFKPPQQETLKFTDIISLIATIKQMFPQQNISEMMEILRTGIDLGQSSTGETSTLDKLIDIFGKIYTQRLDLIKQKLPLQNKPEIPVQNPVNNINVGNKNNVEKLNIPKTFVVPQSDLENKIFTVFAPYKQLLKNCYDNGLPTSMVSLYIYNLCDDDVLNTIFEYFKDEKNYKRFSEYSEVGEEYIKSIVNELKNYATDIQQNE